MKPLIIEIQNFWAWADKFWGIWGIFGLSAPILVQRVPCPCFPLFLQKTTPLYPHPK